VEKRGNVEMLFDRVCELVEGLVERARGGFPEESREKLGLLEQTVEVDAEHRPVDEPEPLRERLGDRSGRFRPAMADLVARERLLSQCRPRFGKLPESCHGLLGVLRGGERRPEREEPERFARAVARTWRTVEPALALRLDD